MGQLDNKTAVVTGGSRGLGRAVVEALAAEGATVWAVARDGGRLEQLKSDVSGVRTVAADVSDPQVAARVLKDICPDILVLNAGAQPHLAPVHEQSWEQFNQAWETDVRSTFEFGREALTLPLQPGSTVIVVSSGAALSPTGSPLSGGYAGAKRTQWLLTQYLNKSSTALNRGVRFIALLPRQIVGDTDLGHAASTAYAAAQGMSKEAYLDSMGAARLTPALVGKGVVDLLTDPAFREGVSFTVNGSTGVEALN